MIQKLLDLFTFSARYWVIKRAEKYFVCFSTWPHGIEQTVRDDVGLFREFNTHEEAVKYMLEEVD